MNAREIRGTNHLPVIATASHNFRALVAPQRGGTWDPGIYRAEIAYVAARGLKQLRMFWSPYAYFVHKADFTAHLLEAAEIIRDAGLQVMLVCTDAVSASARLGANPLLHPWYDLLGIFGGRSWDPDDPANPRLMNGENGLLDGFVAFDRTAFEALYPRAQAGYTFGGWLACPDPAYVCAYEMPDYPAVPIGHEALWRGYVEALDRAIAILDEFGVLHSLDLQNEPTVTTAWAPLVAKFTALGAYADGGGLPLDASQYVPIAEHRLARMLHWLQAYAADRWSNVPTTFGAVDLTSILYVHAALGVPVTTFFSFHTYGNGRYQEPAIVTFRDLIAANKPAWSEIELCCSEFGRWEQGEDMLPFYLHTFEKLGVGAMIWDVFEWPGFGGAFGAAHVPGGAPPAGSAYPVTGLVRSKIVDGTHVIAPRRPDLLPALEVWASGAPATQPFWWHVRRTDLLSFEIWDPRTGEPLPSTPDLHVLWRWASVPRGSIPPFTEGSPSWRTLPPFADFRCMGSWLDVPTTIEVHGRPTVTLSSDLLAELTPLRDVIVHTAFGTPAYAIVDWPLLQWNEVAYLRLTFDEHLA